MTIAYRSRCPRTASTDDEFNEPLEVYGGPKDAPFTWQVTAQGHITLSVPNAGSTMKSARRSSDGSHSNFVDIGQIKMNCAPSGDITFSNSSHEGSLSKTSDKNGLIHEWMAKSTLPRACITDSIPVEIFPDYMNYVFNYPSIDPFGNPCTLSGTITVDKSLIKDDQPYNGILLYNHFTIYATTQAPSRGAVEFPTGAAFTNFIVVAPDYYGFGITEKEPQAYCIARANGRASLDAYLAAKRMIEDLNVKKDDLVHVDKNGEPDGYLCEGPLFEIVPKLPTTVRDLKEYLLSWQEFAFSRGYTAVGDAGAEVIHRAAPQAYYELQEEGKLKLRTYAWMYVADNSDAKTEIARIAAQRAEMSGEYFHIVGAKAFLDGVTEAHTGWQNQDYLDTPGYHGAERYNDHDKMVQLIAEADKEGMSVHVHSEGGGATHYMLGCIEDAEKITGNKDQRNVLAHLHFVTDEDVRRMAETGSVAAVPPLY